MAETAILWLHRDLRIETNPLFEFAAAKSLKVLPVFIWDPAAETPWQPGGASCWWLHHALEDIEQSLRTKGYSLVIRQGSSGQILSQLIQQVGASWVIWNRRMSPSLLARDEQLKTELENQSINVALCHGNMLLDPDRIRTQAGDVYKVFTPFWRAARKLLTVTGSKQHVQLPEAVQDKVPGESLQALQLLPTMGWDESISAYWRPTRDEGLNLLDRFIAKRAGQYTDDRNRPAIAGTSELSPYLHFGQLGVHEVVNQLLASPVDETQREKFIAEIGWREFSQHLLYHFPKITDQPLRAEFEHFPWRPNSVLLEAWQRGQTGFPIVDAGMRQLWHHGWMHNRVRMVVASVLVKHFQIHWLEGARWFWDTLLDADLANNTQGWQWAAGCGADAAPYFRIFNPILQGEKFDPQGEYVKHWCPELSGLPAKNVHKPWEAPSSVLKQAKLNLDEDYPLPLVEHKMGRERALQAYAFMRDPSSQPPPLDEQRLQLI